MALGDILSGLAAAAGGVEQGIAQRRELERQARLQLLQQNLANANMDINRQRLDLERQNYQSEAERRRAQTANEEQRIKDARNRPPAGQVGKYVPEQDYITGEWNYIWHPGAGEAPPGADTSQGHPTVVPSGSRTHPKPQLPVVGTTAAGESVLIDRGAATARPIKGIGGVTDVGKPLSPQERVAASQAVTVEDAVTRLERVARYNPKAFNAAVGFIRASHHGVVGNLYSEARGKLADPDAIEAVQAYQTYLLGITPTYGGVRPTKTLLELESDASLPPWGADPSTWTQSLKTMRSRIGDLRAKAGRAAPASPAPPNRFTKP